MVAPLVRATNERRQTGGCRTDGWAECFVPEKSLLLRNVMPIVTKAAALGTVCRWTGAFGLIPVRVRCSTDDEVS